MKTKLITKLLQNFSNKKGFTLIELLIVIAIMGILATVSLSSYTQTRRTAEVNIQTDTIVSNLREARGKSQNATPDENQKIYCLGYFFTTNSDGQSSIQEVKTEFSNQYTPCRGNQESQPTLTPIPDNELNVIGIQLLNSIDTTNSISADELTILYYPPKGEFLIFQANPSQLNSSTPEVFPAKIQIETTYKDQPNRNLITILNSGVIQKELIQQS